LLYQLQLQNLIQIMELRFHRSFRMPTADAASK
jgi:hypothetical protein